MNFIGTRKNDKLTAYEALLAGYAEDGGLFVPESVPAVTDAEWEELVQADYPERAALILSKFFDDDLEFFKDVCKKAYAPFDGTDPVPLLKIDSGIYMLELFHGPTCSWRDMAARLYPALVQRALEKTGETKTPVLVTATLGDTGKAVLQAVKDVKGLFAAAFHPEESMPKFQRFALSVQAGDNVFVAAIDAGEEDNRKIVKTALLDGETKAALAEKNAFAVSVDYANILSFVSCVAFYYSAYADLVGSEQIERGDKVDFSVPAGDFSCAFAGMYAKKMGLPIGKILSASNRNRAFWDFLKTGSYDANKRASLHTMSPSLNVLWVGNTERLLFEASGRKSEMTTPRILDWEKTGTFSMTQEESAFVSSYFKPGFATEDDTVESMYNVFEEYGYAMDTHTGVACAVADKYLEKRSEKENYPIVIFSVSSPYKFPQDVLYALSGNDVKDSYKGVKRLNLFTAMKPPKSLVEMRYKPPRFKGLLAADSKKVASELVALASGKIVPQNSDAKK